MRLSKVRGPRLPCQRPCAQYCTATLHSGGGGNDAGTDGGGGGLDHGTAQTLQEIIDRLSPHERSTALRVAPPAATLVLVQLLTSAQIAEALADESLSPRHAAQILRVAPRTVAAPALELLAVKTPGKACDALFLMPEAGGGPTRTWDPFESNNLPPPWWRPEPLLSKPVQIWCMNQRGTQALIRPNVTHGLMVTREQFLCYPSHLQRVAWC